MKKIFKYGLAITGMQTIYMPAGAEVLTVGVQDENYYLWAKVDPEAAPEEHTFYVYGTGNPIPDHYGVADRFVGTVYDKSFVWHVYESAGYACEVCKDTKSVEVMTVTYQSTGYGHTEPVATSEYAVCGNCRYM